jgi:hypothetical protein
MEKKSKTVKSDDAKEPKDLRYRKQHFPNAESMVFSTTSKGFIPLPIIFRKLVGHLRPNEVRLLVYLHLRASKYCICYPSLEEIVYDLRLSGRKALTPVLKALETKKLILTATGGGKKFFLILDPRVAIEHLAKSGDLAATDLDEIDDLYEALNQAPTTRGKQNV